MIFDQLKDNNITYAVVIAHNMNIHISGYSLKEYFMIAMGDRDKLRDLGFRLNNSKIMSRDMSNHEIESFRAISYRYKLACVCDSGKVYELPNSSFKTAYETEKKASKLARKRLDFKKRSLPVSEVQYKPDFITRKKAV